MHIYVHALNIEELREKYTNFLRFWAASSCTMTLSRVFGLYVFTHNILWSFTPEHAHTHTEGEIEEVAGKKQTDGEKVLCCVQGLKRVEVCESEK